MKICLFGGTFNPIHNGHINMIKKVLEVINPDRLFVIPSGDSYFKKDVINKKHRFKMTQIALEEINDHRVEISDVELNREGPSYSIVTINQFLSIFKGCELYFVIGEDTLFNINKWYRFEEIIKSVVLLVLRRNNENNNDTIQFINDMKNKYNNKCILIDYDYNISSSQIREMIKNSIDVNHYMNCNVLEYIELNNLYDNV